MSNVFSRDCGRSLKILSIKDHSETAWRQLSLILILSNSVRSEPFLCPDVLTNKIAVNYMWGEHS